MAVNMGSGDPTITARFDGSEVEQGFKDISNAAGTTGSEVQQAGEKSADSFDETAKSVKKTTGSVNDLARAQDRAGDAAESAGNRAEHAVEGVRHDVEMAENAFGDMEEAAEDTADAVEKIGDKADKSKDDVDRMGGSFADLAGLLDIIKDGAEIAYEAIQQMAENGNPAAQRLASSFEKVKNALLAIGETERAQRNMENMSNVIDDGVVPAIKSLGDAAVWAYDKWQNFNALAATGILETIGAIEKGSLDILWADQQRAEASAKAAAAAKDEAAAKDGMAQSTKKATDATVEALDVEKELEAVARSRKIAEQQSHMEKENSIESLQGYVQKMADYAKNEKNTLEDRKLALEYLRNAEARILELKRQQIDPAAELKKLDEERAEAQRRDETQGETDLGVIESRIERQRDLVKSEKASDEEKRNALEYLRELEQRRADIVKERSAAEKKDAEDKAAHAKTVEEELNRINGLENDRAMSRKDIETRIFEINGQLTGQLTKFAKTREEEVAMLKEMETLKRKLLEMDRQSAEEQKRANEESRQAAADRAEELQRRKDAFAETKEGQQMAAVASSDEAIARRYAQQTKRGLGTVRQMMRRGDIGEAELARAARANYEEMYESRFGGEGGKVDRDVAAQVSGVQNMERASSATNQMNMKVLNQVAQGMASFANTEAEMLQFLKQYSGQQTALENSRRSRNAQRFGS